MNVQRRIKRNLLGAAADLPTSTWPSEWKRRTGSGFSGADLLYVSSNDTQRRYVYLYGEVEAAIEFDLPIDLRLTAEPGYQLRFLYQPTQQASENPRVVAYFNAGAHFWSRELQTSTVDAAVEAPRDWLICDDKIDLRDEITQPKAALAFQSGLFDPATAAGDATSEPERDQPIAQEPAWPAGPGELHFSGKALGTEVSPELAEGVSVFVHLKPLALSTNEPTPEFDGSRARYWVEKDGRSYMPICRGGGAHHLTLPVAEDCGWAGGGVYTGTSAYASFTDQSEAGQAGLQVAPTDPDADDDAQPIANAWEIRHDADDPSVNGRTATLRFESVYHADPYEALACIVGPYKLDIADHGQPDYWPSVAEAETIDLHVKVHYAVSGNPEPGIAVEWRHEDELLETLFTGEEGLAVFGYPPTADATIIAVIDSPYKTDTQAFAVKTIPTRKWAQFELSVGGTEISPEDNWRILPGQTYQLTVKPRPDNVLIGQALALTVEPAQSLQLEPTGDRPLTADGLTWSITTASDASGSFVLRLDCIRFKQSPTLNGTTNKLPAPTIDEAVDGQLAPLAALDTLTAVVPQYDDMRSTDEISVTWTGVAGSPEQGSYTTAPVEVGTIGEKTIPLPVSVIAYSLGQSVTVSYSIIRDGDELPPSDLLHLAVQAIAEDDLLVAKPRIPQAANNGEGSELNMNDFTGDVQVRIDGWPHVAVNQYVWLRLKGFKADGSVHDRTLWAAPSWVTPSEYERGYLLATVPSHYLQDLGDSSTLTLEFKVAFGQSTDEANAQTFPLRTYTFRTAMDLSAPRVKQASGTAPSQQLNPVAAKEALTVVLPEYGVQPGDQVRVTWAGTTGGGSHTTPARALPPNREIDIPVSVLAYNLGKPVTVTYTVIRNGETFDPSAALNLAVQTFAPGDLSDSTPRIPQATNNGEGSELNMNNYTGDAKVRIEGWPHIAVGQYVWLRLKGFQADSSEHNLTIWQPPSRVTQGEYDRNELLVTAPYNYLKNLGDSSTLTVEFKVNFSKATDEANAQTFPLRTYTVIQVVVPTLESVSGGDKEIPEGYVTYSTTLQLVGRASKGQKVEIFEGSGSDAVSKGEATVDRLFGIWAHIITVEEGPRRLYAKALYSASPVFSNVRNLEVVVRPTIVSVKDANNNEVPEDILKRYTVSTRLKLSGQASKGRKVAIIDNFDEFLLGEATASSLTGTWELSLTVEVNHYLFFAKALYPVDGSAYSNKRQVYVVPLISPTLDRVRDSNEQEIPDGHNTSSTQLRLNGKASRGQTVEIFDGSGASAVSKGEVTSDVTLGNWMLIITVDRGPHRFYAKSLYHSGAPVYSNVRTLTVVRP